MSERRPHWDDALFESVQKALMGNLGRPAHECMYAVIAAVEDWHSRQSGCEPPCTCWYDAAEQRLRAEEAGLAIQRVRELHCRYDAMDGYVNVRCNCCGHPWPCLTIRALDGDVDE